MIGATWAMPINRRGGEVAAEGGGNLGAAKRRLLPAILARFPDGRIDRSIVSTAGHAVMILPHARKRDT